MKHLSFEEIASQKKLPLLLDGAIGSLLQSEETHSSLWSSELNVKQPEKVIDVHKKYIDEGADIITTNTFRTNPTAYKNSSLDFPNEEFVKKSVELAINARANKNILIAGSNAPAEDCYQAKRTITLKELENNHHKHITYLWESGVDFILNETFSHFDEIKIVTQFCSKNNIPFVVSLYLVNNLQLLDGTSLYEVIDYLTNYSLLSIGINCISPSLFEQIDLSKLTNVHWGFYLNCGSGNVTDETISCGISPKDYVEDVKKYLQYNPTFVGSCCGSSPAHTKALREAIHEIH